MRCTPGLRLLLGLAMVTSGTRAAETPFADFEGDDYGEWRATGDAFGSGPVAGTLPNQRPVSGFQGKRFVNSYRNGDGAQGTLTSPEFVLRHRFINFWIGGGAHPGETAMNLLVEGKVVRTATGLNDEQLQPHTWDVKAFVGKTARIEIVDRATGQWGHVNVDDIRFADAPLADTYRPVPLYGERYRPQFHFTAMRNWLNDPNGLVYYKGEYHLFFQHNPTGRNWGHMTWGHAVSPDLVHWKQLPHALHPDRLGTIYSGSAVVDHANTAGFRTGREKPIIALYTYAGGETPESRGQPFTQALAYSNDRGRTFTKYEKNPILGHVVGGNRDPKVVWHASTRRWIMALYLDRNDFALYASPDLKAWTHLQTFAFPGGAECPDFFELSVDGNPQNTRWVFTAANGHYLIGRFDGRRFTPESGPHPSDRGANFYAVQTYSDTPDGRRIQVAWMNGGSYPGMPFNQLMSFPCELTLRTTPDGIRLYRWPVKEIAKLRQRPRRWEDRTLAPGENLLSGVKGDLFEIELDLEPGDAKEIALTLRGVPIRYDSTAKRISFLERSAELEPEDGRIRLRVLLDRASLEFFGNEGRLSMTSHVLPAPADLGLSLTVTGGAARVRSLTVWPLRSAWPKTPPKVVF